MWWMPAAAKPSNSPPPPLTKPCPCGRPTAKPSPSSPTATATTTSIPSPPKAVPPTASPPTQPARCPWRSPPTAKRSITPHNSKSRPKTPSSPPGGSPSYIRSPRKADAPNKWWLSPWAACRSTRTASRSSITTAKAARTAGANTKCRRWPATSCITTPRKRPIPSSPPTWARTATPITSPAIKRWYSSANATTAPSTCIKPRPTTSNRPKPSPTSTPTPCASSASPTTDCSAMATWARSIPNNLDRNPGKSPSKSSTTKSRSKSSNATSKALPASPSATTRNSSLLCQEEKFSLLVLMNTTPRNRLPIPLRRNALLPSPRTDAPSCMPPNATATGTSTKPRSAARKTITSPTPPSWRRTVSSTMTASSVSTPLTRPTARKSPSSRTATS